MNTKCIQNESTTPVFELVRQQITRCVSVSWPFLLVAMIVGLLFDQGIRLHSSCKRLQNTRAGRLLNQAARFLEQRPTYLQLLAQELRLAARPHIYADSLPASSTQLLVRVGQHLEDIAEFFPPNTTWMVFELPLADGLWNDGESLPASRLLRHNGIQDARQGAHLSRFGSWLAAAQTLTGRERENMRCWRNQVSRGEFLDASEEFGTIETLLQKHLGNFFRIAFPSQHRSAAWVPVFDPIIERQGLLRQGKHDREVLEIFQRYMYGGILVILPPGDHDQDREELRLHLLQRWLQRLGLQVVAGKIGDHQSSSPDNSEDIPLPNHLRPLIDNDHEAQSSPFLRSQKTLDDSPSQMPAKVVPAILLWLSLLLLTWYFQVFWGRAAGWRLHRQLAVFFALALLPIFGLGILFVERSSIERLAQEETRQFSLLQNHLAAADEGLLLTITIAAAQGDRLMRHSFPRQLEMSQILAEGEERLEQVALECLLLGLPVNFMQVIPPGNAGISMAMKARLDLQAARLKDFFSFLVQPILRALNRGLSKTPDVTDKEAHSALDVEGLKMEEALDVMFCMGDPREMASHICSPVSFFLSLGLGGALYFLDMIGVTKSAEKVLYQALWVDDPVVATYYRSRHAVQFDCASSPAQVWVFPFDFAQPMYQAVFPYLRGGIPAQRKGLLNILPDFWPLDRVADPELVETTWNVRNTGTTHTDLSGPKGRRRLTMGKKSSGTDRMTWTGYLEFDRNLETVGKVFLRSMAFVIAAFLVAMLLSIRVAQQFLRPIAQLDLAAQKIRAGDFSARLPETASGELGALQRAFNVMARGVAEGNVLKSFVSDSVQEAARDATMESGALAGERIQAVVLFVKLGGFSIKGSDASPEQLIEQLNLFLTSAARAIVQQGGSIDKFIGNKILAVFRAGPGLSLQQATAAAIRASFAVHQQTSGHLPEHETTLQVGIVVGEVLSGILGTAEVRREFTVIGDTVNLASRLCDAAADFPGKSVLIGGISVDEVQRALAENLVCRQLTALQIKGKSRSVDVCRITAAEPE